MGKYIISLLGFVFAFSSAQAESYSYSKASEKFYIEGQSINKTLLDQFTVSSTVYKDTIKTRYEEVKIYDWVCTSHYDRSSRGNWNGFFNKPKSKKAKALSDSIEQVGPKFAKALVRANVFYDKPDSWSDFKYRIKTASQELGNGKFKSLYSRITTGSTGQRNRENLGYDFSGKSDCRKQVVDTVYENVAYIKSVPYREISLNAKVKITGIVLDHDEKQNITINFKGLDFDGTPIWYLSNIPYTSKHHIQIEEVRGDIEESFILISANRKKTSPKLSDIQISFNKKSSGNISLNLTDRTRLKKNPIAGQAIVKVEVYEDGFWWNNDLLYETSYELDNEEARNTYEVPVNVRGKEIFITYSVSRNNSEIYNTKSSGNTDTNTKDFR